MPKTLLSTKLYLPPARPTHVPRLGPLAALEKTRAHRLTLVCAPPGYGKTALVSAWLAGAGLPCAWLSLDEGDNDPVRFLEYFLTAMHNVVPAVRLDMLDVLQGPAASFEPLAALLINAAANAGDFCLALDDFHMIHAQPILELFTALLEHLPPNMHLLLLSRADPPLPLARLRARGQLLEIRADQLRFSAAEIARFFNEVMGLSLDGADVAAMEARTEGWIAGLQLAALAMQGGNDPHGFVSAFTGSQAYIMDYLTEEVLDQQPAGVRSFLLQTSILERLSGPLCEAVVNPGATEPLDGEAMLAALEQNHLFVVSLDNERRWFRYHHLFNDVLNRCLKSQFPAQISELHRRASQWYEQQGFVQEAVQHSLKAGDRECSVRLVEQHGCDLLMSGEVVTLAGWLAAVEPATQTHAWLAMQKAWALLVSGNPERAAGVIAAGEQLAAALPAGGEASTLRGSFAAARAHLANLQGNTGLAADCAQRALNCLTDPGDFSCSLRSVATSLLGDASWMQGKMKEARRAYEEAVCISQAADNAHMGMMSSTKLADVLFEQGQLHQAARIYAETLHLATQVDGPDSPYAFDPYFGLSRVNYEWNHLEEAAAAAGQCSRLSQLSGEVYAQAGSLALTARLERAAGRQVQAQAALCAADELIGARAHDPQRALWIEATLARLWLELGQVEPALRLVRGSGVPMDPVVTGSVLPNELPYRLEPVYLVLVRLYLAQDQGEAALVLGRRLLTEAQAGERLGRAVELLVLQALALSAQKDLPGALAALESALRLAQSEPFTRVFLDEGEPMARLLYQAKTHGIGSAFVGELLAGFNRSTAAPTPHPDQTLLVEPLSARELEVLRCIAEGCSNQEIAERFVLSPKTVKRHISNIYGKLGAKTRTQAIALARSLGLVE